MKIQYVTPVRMPTEKAHGIQIAKACEAFARAGNDVTLYVPRRWNPIKDSPYTYYAVDPIFKVRKIPAPATVGWGPLGFRLHLLGFALFVRNRLDSNELVYGRDEHVLATLVQLGMKNVVWESHDGAWNRAAAYLTKHIRALVVVTEAARQFYIEHGVPAGKILAVSNGVDLAAFSKAEPKDVARARLGLPQNEKLALYIGRLDGWKGSDTLLEASKLLTSGKLVVIGGEPAQIEAAKKKYPNVLFLGYLPYRDLANNQSAADVLVVPNTGKDTISMRFTSPLKLLAHLASDRPIVASDTPAIREIGKDAVFYVPPDDPKALAEGIEKVLHSQPLADSLVEREKKTISGYDWGHRASCILKHVGGVIGPI